MAGHSLARRAHRPVYCDRRGEHHILDRVVGAETGTRSAGGHADRARSECRRGGAGLPRAAHPGRVDHPSTDRRLGCVRSRNFDPGSHERRRVDSGNPGSADPRPYPVLREARIPPGTRDRGGSRFGGGGGWRATHTVTLSERPERPTSRGDTEREPHERQRSQLGHPRARGPVHQLLLCDAQRGEYQCRRSRRAVGDV